MEELPSDTAKTTTFVSPVIAWEESKWNESLNIYNADEECDKTHNMFYCMLALVK
jgi:hypothetical protein